jgi:hypothetical protein
MLTNLMRFWTGICNVLICSRMLFIAGNWMLTNCIRFTIGICYVLICIFLSWYLLLISECWLFELGLEQESIMFSYIPVLLQYLLLIIECWLIALDLEQESAMFSNIPVLVFIAENWMLTFWIRFGTGIYYVLIYSCLGIYCWKLNVDFLN